MPFKYERKTNRCFRSPPDVLKRAARCVTEEGMSYRKAAANFNVDKMTLMRYMKKKEANPTCTTGYQATILNNRIFSPEMEQQLSSHIVHLADMFFGLSVEKCKELAFQFAAANNLSIPHSWKVNKKAGKEWWKGFKERHQLSIRTPEATSIGRASAFNHHNVKEYFDNLGIVLDKHRLTPDRIFNLDETGVTTVQNPKKVVTATGTKSVGSITSGERGELVTVLYAVCAAGHALAPMLIFPRVRYREHFIRGGPPGCIGRATRSGWINADLFVDFLMHISELTGCSPDRKILVLMDNHESHLSIAAIDKARDLGIVLLTIPPKTSHKLQPLDVSVYGPFKTGYNIAMDNWMRTNPGKNVTIYEVSSLVKEAQMVAMTPRNIMSGFCSTGNWPYNPQIFDETDFAPAFVTDRDIIQDSGSSSADPQAFQSKLGNEQACNSSLDRPTSHRDNASGDVDQLANFLEKATPTSSSLDTASNFVSPQDVLPLPKAASKKNSIRRRGKTRIYTDTPVRDEVEKRQTQKLPKKSADRGKSTKRKLFSKKKAPLVIRSSFTDEEGIKLIYNEDSHCELEEKIEVKLGDYAIVLVAGKSRSLKFVARIDKYDRDDCEYEGVFLQKVNKKIDSWMGDKGQTFIVNEKDAASFAPDDIVLILPAPVAVGGSERRSNQLRFNFDFSKLDLA